MHKGEASQPTVGCHAQREHFHLGSLLVVNHHCALEAPLKHTDVRAPGPGAQLYLI